MDEDVLKRVKILENCQIFLKPASRQLEANLLHSAKYILSKLTAYEKTTLIFTFLLIGLEEGEQIKKIAKYS